MVRIQVKVQPGLTSWVVLLGLSFKLLPGFAPFAAADSGQAPLTGSVLSVVWTASGTRQLLRKWRYSDLGQIKKAVSTERDPRSGKTQRWEGVLTSSFLDEVLGSLPVEGRAQVDLVVLRNRTGQSAFIPRALFAKYPMLLAIEGGSLHSVVPWSSKVRILKEDLPIESFFMSNVTELELTNYKERFSPFFLKRRTDPSAIRGEKLFVQNCVTCHSVERGSSVSAVSAMLKTMEKVNRAAAQSFGVQEHSGINVLTHLTQRDHRSIFRYLEAHRSENPT